MSWLLLIPALFAAAWLLLWRRASFERLPAPPRQAEQREHGSVRGVSFPAKDGTRLDGWLFLPGSPKAPIVLMAPGLGGTKDGFLESFAWAFVERGVAALVFDYRCFGSSAPPPPCGRLRSLQPAVKAVPRSWESLPAERQSRPRVIGRLSHRASKPF